MNLTNKRILITRAPAQAVKFANALAAQGAQPVIFPVIEIVPAEDMSALDRALQTLDQYDWLVLTSDHGVNAFFNRLEALGIRQLTPRLRGPPVVHRTAS